VNSRGGLTFASDDLQRWRWLESPYSGAQSLAGARSFDLVVGGSQAWLATDRGLARIDTRSGGGTARAADVLVWSALNGLPSDVALAVAARPDGAWVGTSSGLVFVTDTGRTRSAGAGSVSDVIASGTAVRALLATGDTLWVGTDYGLDFLPPAATPGGERRLVRAAAQSLDSRLGRQVTALATSDSEVAVATRDAILRFDRRSGRLLPSTDVAALSALGGVRALAMDGNTLWAAGPGGVVVVTRPGGSVRLLSVPADLPAEAYDVALSRDYAWVATRNGVVRLRRFNDGTVP
jgi:ligand-binding sensor domain-containing protein